MGEVTAWALTMLGLAVFFGILWRVSMGAGIKRFVGRAYERGALVICGEEALYFVATVRGNDAKLIRAGLEKSERRVHVWMTQGGRAGDPARALLLDALNEIEWPGQLDEAFEAAVRTRLEEQGVALESLRLACSVPLDDEARARHAWWVCYVDYEGVGGSLCCDALEFWMDARGAGLWSLTTRDGVRLTSAQIDADFRMTCHAAHDLPDNLLGGPLKDRVQLTFADMATPP